MAIEILDILPWFAMFLVGGFFDFVKPLIGAVTTVAGALLGATPLAAVSTLGVVQKARRLETAEIARAEIAAVGTGAAVTGGLRRRTIVETFDPANPDVVLRRTVNAGGVAVFQADVTAAKRVFRQVRKIDKRLPRKTVKESPVKQLTDRVVKNALERAGDLPDCPK